MPQAQNIVLKDATGTDCTFVLATPASANSPAVWYYQDGANRSVWPKLECSSAKSGSGDGRKVKWTLTTPEVAIDSQGVARSVAKQFSALDHTTPALVSAGVTDKQVAFLESLAATSLYQDTVVTGYAPA